MATDRFTKADFEKALPTHKRTGQPLWVHSGFDGEHTYTIAVKGTNKRITIRSSVGSNGHADGSGQDSIRHWVEYSYKGQWWALGKGDTGVYTNRTPGWADRMTVKLQSLYQLALDDSKSRTDPAAQAKADLRKIQDVKEDKPRVITQVACPKCGREMVIRNGQYGDFYGCKGYPNDCRNIIQIDEGQRQLDRKNAYRDGLDKSEDCVHTAAHEPGVPCVYCGTIEPELSVPPKEFEPSTYQQAIFDFISAVGCGNAMVEAVAGSGKTTTIVKALELTQGKVLFCAFNKHIQTELARRAPGHVQVSTVHSIGFRAIRQALPNKPEVDDSKLYNIVKELLPHSDEFVLRQPLCKVVSLAKKTLTDYNDSQALEDMADYYGVELNGDTEVIIGLVPQAMRMSADRLAVIDYDDMIWLPYELGIQMEKFDWVFVDEAQDLSRAQSHIVAQSLRDDGRIILVGDRRQSIYGFTGADCNSIPRLIEEFECQVLPLSITYRCPKTVTALAAKIVPQITAADWALDGEVKYISSMSWMRQVRDGDLVLCRVNAPLVKACFEFIRKGQKAVIRGRDIGKGLLNFIDKLEPVDLIDLIIKISDYKHAETTKLEKAGKPERIELIQDRCDTLTALCDGVADLVELRYKIKEIFDDNTKNGVILSSIHRAKGDESETVYILHRELLPHPLATKDWQQVQEANLEYVAYTRSKHNLVFVD